MRKLILATLALVVLTGCGQNEITLQTDSKSDPQDLAQFAIGPSGEYETDDFDAHEFLTTWNFNNLAQEERSKFYKETPLDDGTLLREYWFNAVETTIEVAPGVFYPAWSYNGQVPGPTIRATEGDTIRIHFLNTSSKPHTVHFHGFHAASMDGSGSVPEDEIMLPGESRIYEAKAEPFGTHVYHCHSYPVSTHISRGLYGAYIVDPKIDTRPKADKELVMVLNGFDTDFDGENDFYAVNTKAFAYQYKPIKVKAGELVRIHLSNMLEFDLINSFHLHANFFDEYPTGTKLTPANFTDTMIMGQAERSILDIRFKEPGMFMFHSHATEFAELGWMGMFMVE
ncbi:MAG: multicopper oxidase domain-containing protein [bacterium]|nr:multicopper oxidase domain-containing protein [bacterium]